MSLHHDDGTLFSRLKARFKDHKLKMEALQQRSDEFYDKYLRAMADFDNFRKRSAKEYLEKELEANRNLIGKLLPVLDNLDRAITTAQNGDGSRESFKTFVQGLELIDQQLHAILEQEGLKAFDSKEEEFDPAKHDAIATVESNRHEPNTVIEEIERGYAFRGKVLRAARVAVSRWPSGDSEQAAPAPEPVAIEAADVRIEQRHVEEEEDSDLLLEDNEE